MSSAVTHQLKCEVEPFRAVLRGDKLFEYRRDDRDPRFEVGHTLRLREYVAEFDRLTGAELRARVTYVLRGSAYGVPPGFAVLGIRPDRRA